MHDLGNVNDWLQVAGAALVVLLGVGVALVRPRTRPNVVFAAFMIAFGGQFIATNVGYVFYDAEGPTELPVGAALARLALVATAIPLLVAMATMFPTRLAARSWRLVGPPVALAIVLASLFVRFARGSALGGGQPLYVVTGVAFAALIGALHGYQLLLALRYAHAAPPEAPARRQFALVSAALVLYVGFVAAAGTGGGRLSSLVSGDPGLAAVAMVMTCSLLVIAGTWLWAGHRACDVRPARGVALLTLAMPVIGLLYVMAGREFGGIGIARTLAVLVLTYAILRHQLLGLDVRIRWTVRQSTIAAVFVAVFFAVSEGAQALFASSSNSTVIGIAAAGALIFAIHPLQRVAERVALAAVPVAPTGGTPRATPNVAAYRTAVELALSDGNLTRDEERSLAKLQTQLGVDAVAALEVRESVERERVTSSSRKRTRQTRSP